MKGELVVGNIYSKVGMIIELSSTRARIENVKLSDLHEPEYVSNLLSDSSKRGVAVSSELLAHLLKASKGKLKINELDEKIISNHVSYTFTKNDYMFKPFNNKLVQLVEAGLADYYVKHYANPYTQEGQMDERVVLTLDHLGTGFLIVFLFLIAAFQCFLMEHLVFKCGINSFDPRWLSEKLSNLLLKP